MTPEHDPYTELIEAYGRGELDAGRARELEAHVASCTACTEELAGFRALHAVEVDELTSAERAELHRVVEASLEMDRSPAATSAPRRSLWQRLAPALGAVGMLAILAVGVAYFGMEGMGGADRDVAPATGASGEDESEDSAERAGKPLSEGTAGSAGTVTDSAPAAGPIPEPSQAQDALHGEVLVTPKRAAHNFFNGVSPRFERRRDTDADRLRSLGKGRSPFDDLADLRVREVGEHRETYLRVLARRAGPDREQVKECGAIVMQREENALPAYAARAEYDGETAVIIGFLWSREDSGRLDQFMIWVWPRGDCTFALDRLTGAVRD